MLPSHSARISLYLVHTKIDPSCLLIPSPHISFMTLLCQYPPLFPQNRNTKQRFLLTPHLLVFLSFRSFTSLLYLTLCTGQHHRHCRRHQYPFVDKPKGLSSFLLIVFGTLATPFLLKFLPLMASRSHIVLLHPCSSGQTSFTNFSQKVIVLSSVVLSALFSPCPLS